MLKVFLLILLFFINLSALVYEDAEDKSTKRWVTVSSKYQGTISNVLDKAKKSQVIKFEGNGTRSIYQLEIHPSVENIKMNNRLFTWEMNYLEDFVILVVVNTIEGKRHLIYTPGGENSYLQYGLNKIKNGKWKKYSRNLEKDLQIYENDNKILDIKYFVIKGSGLIDNIYLKRINQEIALPIEKKPKVPLLSHKNDILPIINLNGKNPTQLKVGEEYIELGGSAKNRDGSEININITSNIDILMQGEYTVIYIATNKLGNTSIDKRQVFVGKITQNKREDTSAKWQEDLQTFRNSKKEEDFSPPKRPLRPGL